MANANPDVVDERCAPLDYIMGKPRVLDVEYLMSNNFAFGGIIRRLFSGACDADRRVAVTTRGTARLKATLAAPELGQFRLSVLDIGGRGRAARLSLIHATTSFAATAPFLSRSSM